VRAAVLGSPVAHSLSPVLHNAGYTAAGLAAWSYDRHQVEEAQLPGFVAGLGRQWRGLSLTMPLKRACLAVADRVTGPAQRAGAGNTLVRQPDGSWTAHNTDIGGLVDALSPQWRPGWDTAAVLGGGATARSALLALADLGVRQARLYLRNPARGAEVADWAAAIDLGIGIELRPLPHWGAGDEPVVVSALPPVAGVADGLAATRDGLLFDVVYADWPTPLARRAGQAGMTVVGGLELLLHQAARQFELFTGVAAPLDAMRAAGLAALAAQPTSSGGAR
jgi:shikimate dehydrogenase